MTNIPGLKTHLFVAPKTSLLPDRPEMFGRFLVFAGLFYKEEIQPKRYNSITRMAKRDLEAARSRGDIDKGGRCYYGEHKVF